MPASARKPPRSRDGGPLLEVKGLRTSFKTREGVVKAVDGIDFTVGRGEIMGLVGESGCGKSVTSLSILRLVASPGTIDAGQILFDGTDLMSLSSDEMRQIRGDRISMIFQQPTSSLNPVRDVDWQISEVLELHRKMTGDAAHGRALELLRLVGIPDPERRLKSFPHELSGGMAQRVMIAMALACEPDLLIADEPTTALDVTIQAQILDLMRNAPRRDRDIDHPDHPRPRAWSPRCATGWRSCTPARSSSRPMSGSLFRQPLHPYTRGPHRLDPGRRRRQGVAGGHPRQRPEPHQPAGRLPVRPALPDPDRART